MECCFGSLLVKGETQVAVESHKHRFHHTAHNYILAVTFQLSWLTLPGWQDKLYPNCSPYVGWEIRSLSPASSFSSNNCCLPLPNLIFFLVLFLTAWGSISFFKKYLSPLAGDGFPVPCYCCREWCFYLIRSLPAMTTVCNLLFIKRWHWNPGLEGATSLVSLGGGVITWPFCLLEAPRQQEADHCVTEISSLRLVSLFKAPCAR